MTARETDLIDQLLSAMLWSRRCADAARVLLPISTFAHRAALAALIDDHDRRHPRAADAGTERVASIAAAVTARAADVRRARARHAAWARGQVDGPEPTYYECPALGLAARASGDVDPLLIARADAVLAYLPELVAAGVDLNDIDLARVIRDLSEPSENARGQPPEGDTRSNL